MKFFDKIENKALKAVAEWGFALIAAVLIFFIVRQFVFINAIVYGDSMLPSFSHNDQILVNRMAYIFGAPTYDDVVAFPYTNDPSKTYVKRIMACPGDTVDLYGGDFYINGERLEDEFSTEPVVALGNVTFPVTVPEDRYFVLGDNRNMSEDSRYDEVGFIKRSDIWGPVFIRFYPVDKITVY